MNLRYRRSYRSLAVPVVLGLVGLGMAAPARANHFPPTYVKVFAGPALADMYPVDVSVRNNQFYVVDPGRYRVAKVDGSTGTVVDQVGGRQGRKPGELGAARAIAHDSAGNVYVADTPNSRVQVFSESLDYVRKWGVPGTGPGQFKMPYGVAVGTDRDAMGSTREVVYVTDQVFRVQKFDLNGNFLDQFGEADLSHPRQLAVHPATGDVYVISARSRQVVVFSDNGVKRFAFGSDGTGDGQFKGDPRGIAINDNGTPLVSSDDLVLVTDSRNYRVQAFGSDGTFKFKFGAKGTRDGFFNEPRGLSFGSGGRIVVADEWDYSLKEFQLNSTRTGVSWVRRMLGTPPPVGGFNSPRGIDVDGTGRVYGVDWWNQRVQRFAPDGSGALAWGFRGTTGQPGSINFAWDLSIQPGTGRVFLANRESNEIEVFSADGAFVTRWGKPGTANGFLKFPHGVDFAPDGTLVVTDSGNNRVQRFSIDSTGKGTWLATYGSLGSGPGAFKVPTGVSVAADGTIWVADTQNNRVQKRSPGGTWTAYSTTAGGEHAFKLPWGVTVGPDGSTWVADSGNDKIVKMSSAGLFDFAVTGSTLGAGAFSSPFKIAFGPGGTIYVSDTWNNRIVQLQI